MILIHSVWISDGFVRSILLWSDGAKWSLIVFETNAWSSGGFDIQLVGWRPTTHRLYQSPWSDHDHRWKSERTASSLSKFTSTERTGDSRRNFVWPTKFTRVKILHRVQPDFHHAHLPEVWTIRLWSLLLWETRLRAHMVVWFLFWRWKYRQSMPNLQGKGWKRWRVITYVLFRNVTYYLGMFRGLSTRHFGQITSCLWNARLKCFTSIDRNSGNDRLLTDNASVAFVKLWLPIFSTSLSSIASSSA